MLINANIGVFYIISAVLLGYMFLQKTRKANKLRSEKEIKGLFGYSIIYLFALFLVIVIDGVV